VSPFTACEPLRGQDLTGKVALVLRGDCNFVQKVWHAQRAHAAAVVVMDNELRHECVLWYVAGANWCDANETVAAAGRRTTSS
jgi:hypothetical protein